MVKRALLCLLFAACNLRALPEPYVVKDLRVIAFIAEPPDASPGQQVTLTAWYFDPSGGGRTVRAKIFRCVDDGQADCLQRNEEPLEVYAEGDADNPSTDLYRFSATVTIPDDAISTGGVLAQFYGAQITYVTRAENEERFIDGLKRVVVKPAAAPKNTNPTFRGFMIEEDGHELGDDVAVTALTRDKRYTLRPLFDPAALEAYTVVDFNGDALDFVEEASFNWSCSPDCGVDQRVTYDQDIVTITPPLLGAEDGRFAIHVLMRDGRGGEALLVRDFELLPEVVKSEDGE